MKQKILLWACTMLPTLFASAQGSLIIQNGTTFKASGNVSIVADSCNITNNGNGDLTSASIYFKGNNNTSFNGTSPLSVQNIYVNKSSASLSLGNDVAVANQVVLQSGLLNLNGRDINLTPTGSIIGENETTRISGPLGGTVNITVNLNAPLAEDPANLGAVFTSSENFGSVIIKRGHKQQTDGAGKSIFRYYDITPANNSALNTVFRMKYLDAELDGIDESELKFYKSTDDGLTFTDEGFSSRNTSSNFVNLSNVNSFARLTLASPSFPLPVSFTAFTAKCINGIINISFTTAQEINADKFIVQRSYNNTAWTDVASINATNTSSAKTYSYADGTSNSSNTFYRIKAVDKDGSVAYSAVQEAASCDNNKIALKLQPIPVKNNAVLTVNSDVASAIQIIVYSADGKQLLQQNTTLTAGKNTINLNFTNLRAGNYYLTARWGNGVLQRVAFIK